MTERLWAPWRLEYVAGAGDTGGCIFCDKPALSDDEALILHRGRHAFVVLNLYPYANGHLMVAPYRHLPMPGELNADERAELWQLADDGITALTAAMAPHGFNCGMNLGRVAGAGVEGHLHSTWCRAGTATPTSCRCWLTHVSCPSTCRARWRSCAPPGRQPEPR